ncbi:MAG TPA: hypothetical protein VG755_25710, partial [Nannocystaceae bacterium]|nr:hypothetical protein [Nannocystaceae bacterium]
ASQVEQAARADDGPHYSLADTQLAKLARRRGDLRRARELLERGVTLISEDDEPTIYAEAHFELAQVLWELGGDRERAIALVEAAIVRLGELPDEPGFTNVTEMRAWLEQHRPEAKPPSLAPHG